MHNFGLTFIFRFLTFGEVVVDVVSFSLRVDDVVGQES